MSKPLKLWNGRGDYRRYERIWICAPTKIDAARMLAQAAHPEVFKTRGGTPEWESFVGISYREISVYYGKSWGTSMDGVTPERGVWATKLKDTFGKPERIL